MNLVDSLDVFDFSFTGGLNDIWSATNDAIEMNGISDDLSASPVSSSGSEERPSSCEVNYQLLPQYQQGEELTSIFSDDFPLLDMVLGDDAGNNPPQKTNQPQPSITGKPQSEDEVPSLKEVKEELGLTDVEKSRRNAIAAKKNRERKKAQMAALEKEVDTLSEENSRYKKRCSTLENAVLTLNKEVEYYKSVLANDSVLSKLLQNIPNVKGVRLASSLGKRPHSLGTSTPSKLPRLDNSTSGGVCLHVSKDFVSLELCAHCSNLAGASSSSSK